MKENVRFCLTQSLDASVVSVDADSMVVAFYNDGRLIGNYFVRRDDPGADSWQTEYMPEYRKQEQSDISITFEEAMHLAAYEK